MDYWIGGRWLLDYRVSAGSILALSISCLVAVAVNASQFACLGRFQATTFQVHLRAKFCVLAVSKIYINCMLQNTIFIYCIIVHKTGDINCHEESRN